MSQSVRFGGERLDLEIAPERLVASWSGPATIGRKRFREEVREALETSLDYPPLRQAVVPGDRVVIPVSPGIPRLGEVLEIVAEVLESSGVERGAIRVLRAEGSRRQSPEGLPNGLTAVEHDSSDRSNLAYLATTQGGRRVYLNRLLTDADFVLPIGLLGFDDRFGFRGPWSTIFPLMSDLEPRRQPDDSEGRSALSEEGRRTALTESAEVGWLLGSQYQIGVLPGEEGPAGIFAGRDDSVRQAGSHAVEESWTFRAPDQADLVVAGVGLPDSNLGWEDLARGMPSAARLVRPGGKIVILSTVRDEPGPALRHLAEQAERGLGAAALRGHQQDPDYDTARRVAESLVRADVYLLSQLDPDFVEELGIVPLSRPEEAARLAVSAPSCTLVSGADLVRVRVPGES